MRCLKFVWVKCNTCLLSFSSSHPLLHPLPLFNSFPPLLFKDPSLLFSSYQFVSADPSISYLISLLISSLLPTFLLPSPLLSHLTILLHPFPIAFRLPHSSPLLSHFPHVSHLSLVFHLSHHSFLTPFSRLLSSALTLAYLLLSLRHNGDQSPVSETVPRALRNFTVVSEAFEN